MSATEIKIDTSSVVKDFSNHLNYDRNNRILFSGPFGTGKSTFLQTYFDEYGRDYFPVKIYPVHYSVASNEDVFELIKYDILIHLLAQPNEILELKNEDFSKFLKSQYFVQNRMKYKPLLYSILGLSDKIGTPVIEFLKELDKIYTDFKEFDEETKIDEKKLIENYLLSFENIQGGIYENDTNSQLINELLERIKTKENTPLKPVLIIDDLDRLDPEHIFRLFNVFSSHHDEITNTNKFGFDKVIFVCDVENIRKIFHHKYGADVDFSGYIDKFYSTAVFDFDNRKYIKEATDKILKSINFGDESLQAYNFYNNKKFSAVILALTYSLIENRFLTLRKLFQYPVFRIPNETIILPNGKEILILNSPILVFFHLFKNFFSSLDLFEKNLEELSSKNDSSTFSNLLNIRANNAKESHFYIISFCLHFLLEPEIAFYDDMASNLANTAFSDELNCYIQFQKFFNPNNVNFYYKDFIKATKLENDQEELILNPYEVLLITLKKCRSMGYLR